MKTKRPKLILRKGIALAALALPAAGCANTPEEAFRAAFDDACETVLGCGLEEPVCATEATRAAVVAELVEEIREEGATLECEEAILTAYADLYSCYSNLACAQIASGDGEDGECGESLDEAAIDRACPELDL